MRGFSLLELLVVLAIIAILASIAYPLYTDHIRKSHRSAAKTALIKTASALEHYRTIQNTYSGASLRTLGIVSPQHYQLTLQITADASYLISATPKASQRQDTLCGRLSLNHSGEKRYSGTGSFQECW